MMKKSLNKKMIKIGLILFENVTQISQERNNLYNQRYISKACVNFHDIKALNSVRTAT